MNGREVKQCEICRCLYTRAELETMFTGRRVLVCYKCVKDGLRQTGHRLNTHKSKAEKVRGY